MVPTIIFHEVWLETYLCFLYSFYYSAKYVLFNCLNSISCVKLAFYKKIEIINLKWSFLLEYLVKYLISFLMFCLLVLIRQINFSQYELAVLLLVAIFLFTFNLKNNSFKSIQLNSLLSHVPMTLAQVLKVLVLLISAGSFAMSYWSQ